MAKINILIKTNANPIIERGIAVPLYQYFYEHSTTIRSAGKIEYLITDKQNVDKHATEPAVYNEVAKALARVHSIPYSALPLSIKYNDCDDWNWNTNCTYQYLKTAWNGGDVPRVADRLGIPESEMDNEYKWIAEMVQKGAPGVMFFSHNDPHGGNMMIHVEDGNADPTTYQLIDFDNAEFGYRAWDYEYYFCHMSPVLTTEQEDEFLLSYLSVFNELNEQKYTLEEIRFESEHHRPYVLMEQMLLFRNRFLIFILV